MEIIAHRGYSYKAPENTIAAFDLALESGFPHMEFDVQLTADDVPVVIHDETVDRTTDGSGDVANMSLNQISKLDAGAWFRRGEQRQCHRQGIPTLNEVLQRYSKKTHLYIELKSMQSNLPLCVVSSLDDNGWLENTTKDVISVPGISIFSFHLEQIRRSKLLIPQISHCWLIRRLDSPAVETVIKYDMQGLIPHVRGINSSGIAEAHSAGVRVATWGIDTLEELDSVAQLGVFGAIVDWPSQASDFLASKP